MTHFKSAREIELSFRAYIGKKHYEDLAESIQNGKKIDSMKMFHYNRSMKQTRRAKSSPENAANE